MTDQARRDPSRTPTSPPPELLGRDDEWSTTLAFLGQIAGGPAAAIIEGEAGIGKTTLWQAALQQAGADPIGLRVHRARPVGGDDAVSYAVLLELFDELPQSVPDRLPAPQRDALEVALRRRTSNRATDPGTIAVASLAAVRALAVERPVLLAIDDLHEVDPAGLRVLEFIVRRLRTERVGLLVAQRPIAGSANRLRLADAFGTHRVHTIRPGGISIGALNRLLTGRLGVAFARPLVLRIHAATAGNPQFALEIARELKANGVESLPASAPLPVPGTIQEVVGGRLARLPRGTREIIAFAAEMERPSRSILRALMGPDADQAVDDAVAADVLTEDGSTLRFTHPTVRAAAAVPVRAAGRRQVHARLAELTSDDEERAHHLGRSTVAPSETVAAALDRGAEAAAARGAPEAALRLRDRALELTPKGDARALARRQLALADGLSDAGDLGRARSLLQGVLDAGNSAAPETRYAAVILLGGLLWYDNQADAGRALLRRSLEEAHADRIWQARVHSRLAWMADDDLRQAAVHAEAAFALLRPEDDPAAYAFALLNRTLQVVLLGGPPDETAIRRGELLQAQASSAELSSIPGLWPKYADRFGEARAWLANDLARLRARGDEGSIGQTLGYLAELEAWTGRLSEARQYAEEAREITGHIGQQGMLIVATARVVLVDSIEGHDLAASAGLAEMRRLEAELPDVWTAAMCEQTEVFLAITAGDLARADHAATQATALLDGVGLTEPAMYRFHADQIEAVIGLGDLERAERLLLRFEERGRIFPRPSIAATSARCRALLAAARGDHAAAIDHLDRSLAAHEDLDWPLERIRTMIAGAQVLRRANRRKRAHELAMEASRLANELGAPGWAARARAEAARTGLEHGAGDRLTPSERRMAELAAGGATNREIGDRLLVSPKTVEATLARAYAKLGIRSRAQLHARLEADRPGT